MLEGLARNRRHVDATARSGPETRTLGAATVGCGILRHMPDTWESRDLPVLKAAVEIFDRTGRGSSAAELGAACGFDKGTVQRALRALYREPFFEEPRQAFSGDILAVGRPTSAALRVAGQWPTPETQLERLIAAFEAAADDDARPETERSRFKQAALWLGGVASQVAIGALGGAGGNLING